MNGRPRQRRRSRCDACPLALVRPGERFRVTEIEDDYARTQALRFGMAEGSIVECIACIPFGPTVIKAGRQEIAVGRNLAERIHVRPQVEAAGGIGDGC